VNVIHPACIGIAGKVTAYAAVARAISTIHVVKQKRIDVFLGRTLHVNLYALIHINRLDDKASVANYVPIDCPVPNPERNAEHRKRERHPKVNRLTITGRRTSAAATSLAKDDNVLRYGDK
jgi:hypothetical protein